MSSDIFKLVAKCVHGSNMLERYSLHLVDWMAGYSISSEVSSQDRVEVFGRVGERYFASETAFKDESHHFKKFLRDLEVVLLSVKSATRGELVEAELSRCILLIKSSSNDLADLFEITGFPDLPASFFRE